MSVAVTDTMLWLVALAAVLLLFTIVKLELVGLGCIVEEPKVRVTVYANLLSLKAKVRWCSSTQML